MRLVIVHVNHNTNTMDGRVVQAADSLDLLLNYLVRFHHMSKDDLLKIVDDIQVSEGSHHALIRDFKGIPGGIFCFPDLDNTFNLKNVPDPKKVLAKLTHYFPRDFKVK